MKYTQPGKYWKLNLIVTILKNCIVFLSDLSDFLIVKTPTVGYRCRNFDRGTVSPEICFWLQLIDQVTLIL